MSKKDKPRGIALPPGQPFDPVTPNSKINKRNIERLRKAREASEEPRTAPTFEEFSREHLSGYASDTMTELRELECSNLGLWRGSDTWDTEEESDDELY